MAQPLIPTCRGYPYTNHRYLPKLLINAKLYIIGDQYDVQPLKKLAKKRYEQLVVGHWNSDSFVASLRLLYEETPETHRPMKDVAVKVVKKHTKELCARDDFMALCTEKGEVAVEALKEVLNPSSLNVSKSCSHCHFVNIYTIKNPGNYRTQVCRSCGRNFS